MHPRLRRQLASLRTELPPAFRQLIAAIDAHYREFDAERAELEESLASMTALLHRAQSRAAVARGRKKERRGEAGEGQRRPSRLLRESRGGRFEAPPHPGVPHT